MTNREKFKDELVEFRSVAFDITDNKVKECCYTTKCIHCQFCDYNIGCNEAYQKWLDKEYIQPKKQPTTRDIEIMKACNEIFGLNYFAKDKSGLVYGYQVLPFKQEDVWVCLNKSYELNMPLSHLSWDDDEPYYFKGE